jgi:hypothetical protein
MLRNDFYPYQMVYWLRRLMRRFLFRTIHHLALMLDRDMRAVSFLGWYRRQPIGESTGRERVRHDEHKKISGRKRHTTADTDGRLLAVNLTPRTSPIQPSPNWCLMLYSSAG